MSKSCIKLCQVILGYFCSTVEGNITTCGEILLMFFQVASQLWLEDQHSGNVCCGGGRLSTFGWKNSCSSRNSCMCPAQDHSCHSDSCNSRMCQWRQLTGQCRTCQCYATVMPVLCQGGHERGFAAFNTIAVLNKRFLKARYIFVHISCVGMESTLPRKLLLHLCSCAHYFFLVAFLCNGCDCDELCGWLTSLSTQNFCCIVSIPTPIAMIIFIFLECIKTLK